MMPVGNLAHELGEFVGGHTNSKGKVRRVGGDLGAASPMQTSEWIAVALLVALFVAVVHTAMCVARAPLCRPFRPPALRTTARSALGAGRAR